MPPSSTINDPEQEILNPSALYCIYTNLMALEECPSAFFRAIFSTIAPYRYPHLPPRCLLRPRLTSSCNGHIVTLCIQATDSTAEYNAFAGWMFFGGAVSYLQVQLMSQVGILVCYGGERMHRQCSRCPCSATLE